MLEERCCPCRPSLSVDNKFDQGAHHTQLFAVTQQAGPQRRMGAGFRTGFRPPKVKLYYINYFNQLKWSRLSGRSGRFFIALKLGLGVAPWPKSKNPGYGVLLPDRPDLRTEGEGAADATHHGYQQNLESREIG